MTWRSWETGSTKPWYLLPIASVLLFCEGGCFSGVHSVVPHGEWRRGCALGEKSFLGVPNLHYGGLFTAPCDRPWVGVG